MDRYKVIFIDEEIEQQNEVENYFDKYNEKIDLIAIVPRNSIELMMQELDEYHPDAIISDFSLNEMKGDVKGNIPYNGVELREEYLKRREGFPFIVLTAYDYQAVPKSEDVNAVYVKASIFNEENENPKVTFGERVIYQIDHYRKNIEDKQSELENLIEKRRKGETSCAEEQRIIELDSFLERALDKKNAIPVDLKISTNSDRLKSLLDKTDEILKKLEANEQTISK